MKLPDGINSNGIDRFPVVSPDGHWLYFSSDRPGGMGNSDIYASWREDVNDDFAWQSPVNLVEVNTPMFDWEARPFVDEESGTTYLYLTKGFTTNVNSTDLFMCVLGPNGWEPPSPLTELNSPAPSFDGGVALRRDSREIFITSNRPGTLGKTDIWVSRRASINDPWSTPENVTVLNDPQQSSFPVLSWDGRTMYLAMGDNNANDIYVTHREFVSAANICFRSPQYYLLNLQPMSAKLGNASVVVSGVNYNHPIGVANNLDLLQFVLQGNSFPGLGPSTPQDRLNQEFLAAQLSLAMAGGNGSYGVLQGQLQCYDSLGFFQPVLLSNGVKLTYFSTLGDLFEQARLAIYENRTADMDALAPLFDRLNGNDPSGNCHP